MKKLLIISLLLMSVVVLTWCEGVKIIIQTQPEETHQTQSINTSTLEKMKECATYENKLKQRAYDLTQWYADWTTTDFMVVFYSSLQDACLYGLWTRTIDYEQGSFQSYEVRDVITDVKVREWDNFNYGAWLLNAYEWELKLLQWE